MAITYDASSGSMIYANGWTTIFANAELIGCPVSSCQLMNHDCTSVPSPNVNFFMESADPWELKYKRNIVNGWAA